MLRPSDTAELCFRNKNYLYWRLFKLSLRTFFHFTMWIFRKMSCQAIGNKVYIKNVFNSKTPFRFHPGLTGLETMIQSARLEAG